MKLGEDLIKSKFDDVEEKVDFLIELCQALQQENEALTNKIKELERALENKNDIEHQFSEQETFVQLKIDRLLNKLDEFSNRKTGDT